MKRFVLALATCMASLLALGSGTAFASCDGFTLDASGARANDVVGYHIANCVTNDWFELNAIYEDGVNDQGQPKTTSRSLHADGVALADGTFDGTFQMIDLGDAQKDVKIELTVNGSSTYGLPAGTTFSYLGPAPTGSTGPTGNTGPAGSTGPVLTVPPLAVQQPLTSSEKPKKTKKKSTKKESSSKNKSKSKSNSKSKKHSGSSNPTSTPSTPAPTTPTYTPPVTSTPSPVTSTPPSDIKPPSTPTPPATPPGIQGPGGGEPTAPTPPAPAPPAATVPVAPVAASGGDSNSMSVPVWLVILLGLVALLGLGGAQARLLGLWGPPVPINGRDTTDARLLALQRVSQSGASFQKRIAELKKAAREREPVG